MKLLQGTTLPVAVLALATLGAILTACSGSGAGAGGDAIRVGAVYPLSGTQGPGGLAEFHGVEVAASMVNALGGVGGRPIQLEPIDTPEGSVAGNAISLLHQQGVRLVVGSYASTISAPASAAAARNGMLYWETGAVGQMAAPDEGQLVFRVAPTGATLGSAAIDFVARQLAPRLHRTPASLRTVVINVNDVYGNEVVEGALRAVRAEHLHLVGHFAYNPYTLQPRALARRIAAAKPDVLFAAAYVEDGVALRRALVDEHVHLLAAIGSSSSYCMPAFGRALGADAVGVFASDKPDAGVLDPSGLAPSARTLLAKASAQYRARFHTLMNAPALAGFSAGWALFRWTMPHATSITPDAISVVARGLHVPEGGLPNGSGIEFAPPGSPTAGSNLLAASVIWEWTAVDQRWVVWPERYATWPIKLLRLAG
jgi:branched-chain amino acid transport system substrate-binding protein